MKHNFALSLLILATAATSAFAQKPGGQPVTVYDLDSLQKNTVPIVIAGDTQLAAYAHKAFESHGRYSRVTSGGDFTLTFSPVSATQVRVDIAKKGSPTITTVTAGGADARDALYRAADAAVKNTSGTSGYFTSRLAFVSNNTGKDEIYVSDLFLNEARAVTNQRASILMPRWSPDGSRILYTSLFRSNSPDLFQLDLRSGRWTTYADYKGTNMGARYSPDGSRVVFVIGHTNDTHGLYIGTPDGRAKPRSILNSPDAKSSPCFSPDGQRIVFAMAYGSSPQLYIMPAGGGTPERIKTGASYSAEPDWSQANPNLIVFTARRNGAFCIGVYDLSTKKTRFITPKTSTGAVIRGDFLEPSWLPDGRHVVCTSRPSGDQRYLYILDTVESPDGEEKAHNRATKISALRAEHASVLPQP
ncbi:PD40 domain-containing protein [Ereboglobus luteus]|uniref:Biopolymer transporter Tol n=1 Tax=Ereboglobus luteus TaxID=1796921 RepID=A0A2U8E1G2_9BACT|nr:PD40 domain-containing protein [Ereboglobus luteus]AWI08703.1 hypothetical protein CKA38_05040 [Ereboglobus luteus]